MEEYHQKNWPRTPGTKICWEAWDPTLFGKAGDDDDAGDGGGDDNDVMMMTTTTITTMTLVVVIAAATMTMLMVIAQYMRYCWECKIQIKISEILKD